MRNHTIQTELYRKKEAKKDKMTEEITFCFGLIIK